MRPLDLKLARMKRGWRQVEAARRLGVSQPYLAMLEEGKRRLTADMTRKAALVYGMPLAALPLSNAFTPAKGVSAQHFVELLSGLGYPGFAYVRPLVRKRNPAEVLLTALAQDRLEARVAEGLPWLLLHHWQMNSGWLVGQAKRFDLQNRLGFVAALARRLSQATAQPDRTEALSRLETTLDHSRLAREDYFFRPPRNPAERKWLSQHRSREARHWNLLSDLRPEHLNYADLCQRI